MERSVSSIGRARFNLPHSLKRKLEIITNEFIKLLLSNKLPASYYYDYETLLRNLILVLNSKHFTLP